METMLDEIEQRFNEKLLTLHPNDATFAVRIYLINIEKAENLDALESMNERKEKSKRKFFDIDKNSKIP